VRDKRSIAILRKRVRSAFSSLRKSIFDSAARQASGRPQTGVNGTKESFGKPKLPGTQIVEWRGKG